MFNKHKKNFYSENGEDGGVQASAPSPEWKDPEESTDSKEPEESDDEDMDVLSDNADDVESHQDNDKGDFELSLSYPRKSEGLSFF